MVDHNFDSLLIKKNNEQLKKDLNEAVLSIQPMFFTLNGYYLSEYFVTNVDNAKLIHLIYKNKNGSVLYSYQVPPTLIKNGNSFELTEDLFDYIHSENCFAIKKDGINYLLKAINGSIIGVAGQNLDRQILAGICNQKPI